MWLVVGLGNPGLKYTATRHNIGFAVVDELVRRSGVMLRERNDAMIGQGSIEGHPVTFMEPLTFMNLSGTAVAPFMRKGGIDAARLIVVQDDLDMEIARLKIKTGGGPGGHNGIRSIIEHTGARDFIRVKIGIGRDQRIPAERYVLMKIPPEERDAMAEIVIDAADAVELIISSGIERAMGRFNTKMPQDGQGEGGSAS